MQGAQDMCISRCRVQLVLWSVGLLLYKVYRMPEDTYIKKVKVLLLAQYHTFIPTVNVGDICISKMILRLSINAPNASQ